MEKLPPGWSIIHGKQNVHQDISPAATPKPNGQVEKGAGEFTEEEVALLYEVGRQIDLLMPLIRATGNVEEVKQSLGSYKEIVTRWLDKRRGNNDIPTSKNGKNTPPPKALG